MLDPRLSREKFHCNDRQMLGKFVVVQKEALSSYLAIAEVEIFGLPTLSLDLSKKPFQWTNTSEDPFHNLTQSNLVSKIFFPDC